MLLFSLALQVRAQSGTENSESVREFVQRFYSWYVPKAVQEHYGPASDLALKYRSHAFSSELLRALKEDSEAQARVKGVIVGLDFDPFLNTQDPCEGYELGNVTRKGNDYWVEVYSVCSGKQSEHPDVVCVVGRKNGNWVFVNFLYKNMMKEYPNSADLLAVLKLLREERQKDCR
jgi:hypothetical protein